MPKHSLAHAVCILLQVLSFIALWLGKVDAAMFIVLHAIFLQLVIQNMKD